MARIIAISNHKGGVGKTTSTINIGAALNLKGKKVLLIDLDPQANLTQSLQVNNSGQTTYDILKQEAEIKPIMVLPGFDVLPSTLDLSGAEIELSGEAGREFILKDRIDAISRKYDYILIDTPPSLGLLTINAFTAAGEVIIPLQAQFLAMQGIAKLNEIIEKIKKRLNKTLRIGGVIITQYDSRIILNKNVADTIAEHFKDRVFETKIRNNIALAEAPAQGLDIFRYNAKSAGAEDYLNLAAEIMKAV